jgi:hypothetical protein
MRISYILPLVIAVAVSACGKNDGKPVSSTSASQNSNESAFKNTEKFGYVSAIDLEPVFTVPSKYSSYVHQELTEMTNTEMQKLPDSAFESYVSTWIKQAASVDKPDWQMLSGILHPEITEETNAFKKQDAAEKAKTEIQSDKNSLNVVFGLAGEILTIAGPDVSNGEYYITIGPDRRYDTIFYSKDKPSRYNYRLSYHPVFKDVGMQIDCDGSRSCSGDIAMTVKVPIEKAKEIESMRANDHERHPGMVRVYGHVTGTTPDNIYIRKDSSSVALDVQVEAIEIGSRQNGQFKSYFFLDKDQLKRWHSDK